MAELLFEIGCEELPAEALPMATRRLAELAEEKFTQARLEYSGLQTWSTPRRLTLAVNTLADRQAVSEERVTGPAWNIAFSADGTATRAAEGFAAKQGVPVSKLVKITTEKGEYVGVARKLRPEKTARLLPAMLEELISAIPFPKSMRWGSHEETFGRPVHWILALYNGRVVRVEFTGIRSGKKTRGHRFLAPKPFAVHSIEEYRTSLAEAYVMVDPLERKRVILEGLEQAAVDRGGRLLKDEELLDEVTNLVEWPVPLVGEIEPRFLEIPREVIVTSMKDHQRYFSLLTADGKLLPNFITVSNMVARDPAVIVAGNQRVLAARLSDAMFFVREDMKTPLGDRIETLKSIVFQKKLGTIYEKVERFTSLAGTFNARLKLVDAEALSRASWLTKADLTTGMVGEFPELQGTIGAEYAGRQNEAPDVVQAIVEHYLPRHADDALPGGHLGALIACADKLDTVVGCFGVGLIPSGTADPYALRRAALGILNIMLDKKYALLLTVMVDASLDTLEAKLSRPRDEVRADVLQFFRGRFENLERTRGMAPDEIVAVLSRGFDDVVDGRMRIEALHRFRRQPAFSALAGAFKRTANILQKELGSSQAGPVDPALMTEAAEQELLARIDERADRIGRLFEERHYEDALTVVSELRDAVDRFFDDVLVVAEDPRVKANRLALLARLRALFDSFADFTQLGGASTPVGS